MARVLSKWREMLPRFAAEFATIVLGVTVALWADGWVTARSDRAVETARLSALRDNVVNTLIHVRSARENATGAVEALRRLVTLVPDDTDVSTAEALRYGMLFGPGFFPELNVYDDLKSSGELALLTNRDLRQALATMDARLANVRRSQADVLTVQQLNVDSYMIDSLDLRELYGPMTGIQSEDDAGEFADFAFIGDTRFRNTVLLKLDVVMVLESVLSDAETALLDVHQIIDVQLQ